MHKITSIEGIGEKYAERLHRCGVDYQEQLLERCLFPKERQELARMAGISHKLIMKWTNQADLARIKGIGEEYSELLERAGIDTVPELAMRNANNLLSRIQAANEELSLVRKMPSDKQVEMWVMQAKSLPRMINY